jgi:hypothetical protein
LGREEVGDRTKIAVEAESTELREEKGGDTLRDRHGEEDARGRTSVNFMPKIIFSHGRTRTSTAVANMTL